MKAAAAAAQAKSTAEACHSSFKITESSSHKIFN